MTGPRCPLCECNRTEPRFSERGHRVFRCAECGLFFIDPYPPKDAEFRTCVIDNSYEGIDSTDSISWYRGEVNFYQSYFPLVARECENARSILDIGCGSGRLLELLADRPDLVRVGIELNDARAAEAERRVGCPVHRVPIEQFECNERFDVITFINVLSHIPWFDPVFHAVNALLADGGRFILKTGELVPDVRKDDVFDWAIPVHVHFLGTETIGHLCRRYGFRVVRHIRIPLADELFSPATWNSPGTSAFRNIIKSAAVRTPFLLPLLRRWYLFRHGTRIYSSFIVLERE